MLLACGAIRDLNATILHQLGIDHNRFTYPYRGLDQKLTGVEPVASGSQITNIDGISPGERALAEIGFSCPAMTGAIAIHGHDIIDLVASNFPGLQTTAEELAEELARD